MSAVTRDELYALVWSQPMGKVAERFGVSGSYMARVCTDLRVPRPARGYWAKLAVGRSPNPTPLPKVQPGDPAVWSKGNAPCDRAIPLTTDSQQSQAPKPARHVRGTHGLIACAKWHFLSGRQVEEGEYLKPYKRLLVDINSSESCLDRALSFANQLFNTLEAVGHRVGIAPECEKPRRPTLDEHENPKKNPVYPYSRLWFPCRPTVVYIGNVAVGLALVEMSEEVLMRYVDGKYVKDADYRPAKSARYRLGNTWTIPKDLPCHRLRLFAYSPYRSVSWSTSWQDGSTSSLTNDIPAIASA